MTDIIEALKKKITRLAWGAARAETRMDWIGAWDGEPVEEEADVRGNVSVILRDPETGRRMVGIRRWDEIADEKQPAVYFWRAIGYNRHRHDEWDSTSKEPGPPSFSLSQIDCANELKTKLGMIEQMLDLEDSAVTKTWIQENGKMAMLNLNKEDMEG
jgi:hypothetical protein